MKCSYCGRDNEKDAVKCAGCSAKLEENSKKVTKYAPLYFHGFIVYQEFHPWNDITIYHIFEGDKHVGQFEIDRYMIEEYHHLVNESDCCDIDPLIYKLLRLAVWDSEVERIENLNKNEQWIIFEIRRIENPTRIESRDFIRHLINK